MKTNVYSIIWADDESATLSADQSIRKMLDGYNIEVLRYVKTSVELREALTMFLDKVDAVVVDGNFSKDRVDYLESDDISGLMHTISFIEVFNSRRDIPFFLYTARKVEIQKICKNKELSYFIENKRLIQKGNIEKLVKSITEAVDHIHSKEYQVKKKHLALLKEANRINEKCHEYLWKFLLNEEEDISYNNSIETFNDLRLILDNVFTACKDDRIIPEELKTMNDIKRYFYYGNDNGFKYTIDGKEYIYNIKKGILQQIQIKTLTTLIDIVQDGSHDIKELTLHVSEYVRDTSRPYLFRSCLYLVMDVIRWYNDINKKLVEGTLSLPLYYKIESKTIK